MTTSSEPKPIALDLVWREERANSSITSLSRCSTRGTTRRGTARVLQPRGTLLLGYFDGTRIEPFDHAVARAFRRPAHELSAALETAGFDILETHRRSEQGHRPVGAILCESREL